MFRNEILSFDKDETKIVAKLSGVEALKPCDTQKDNSLFNKEGKFLFSTWQIKKICDPWEEGPFYIAVCNGLSKSLAHILRTVNIHLGFLGKIIKVLARILT